jgi:Mn-dependent DtxR family transcriptional regulator
LPAAEVLSFLKETRGTPEWTVQDLARSLNVSVAMAEHVVPFLQAQGYIEASKDGKWLTTMSGDTVSGSRPPRFSPEAVEAALSALAE